MSEIERRRRRVRQVSTSTRSDEPPEPGSTLTPPAQNPHPPAAPPQNPFYPGGGGTAEDRELERGLRGLIGAGASQLTRSTALRARDASRPTAADLAAAEQQLVVVRRNWVPHEDLPGSVRGQGRAGNSPPRS